MKSGWSNSNKSRKKALATRQWYGRWMCFFPKKINQFSEGDFTYNSRRSYDGLLGLFSRYTRLWVTVPLTCDRIWSCRHESTKTIQTLKFVTTEVITQVLSPTHFPTIYPAVPSNFLLHFYWISNVSNTTCSGPCVASHFPERSRYDSHGLPGKNLDTEIGSQYVLTKKWLNPGLFW